MIGAALTQVSWATQGSMGTSPPPPTNTQTIWLDPSRKYLGTKSGLIFVTKSGEPLVP